MAKKLKPQIQKDVKFLDIVDADTMVVELTQDIGFDEKVVRKLKLRIRHYDAPETQRPRNEAEKEHGTAATLYAVQLLSTDSIEVWTYKKGKYGRYEADIKLNGGADFVEVMKSAGFQKLEHY